MSKRILMGITAAMVGFVPMTSYATPALNEVPTGGSVELGKGDVQIINNSTEDKGLMNIVQTSDRAIINWDTFNVGSNSVVNFIHLIQSKGGDKELVLNTAGSTLNIVNASGGMSEIYGTINSVGSFILVNQNGILFAGGSEVNAAGIVASTAPIDESRYFNNAQLIFEQDKGYNNSVIADGKLDANTYYDGNTTQNEGTKAITEQFGNDVAAAAINAAMKQSDALKKQFGGEMPTINMATVNAATGFAVGENSIKLVADGDVVVGEHANIVANRVHELSGKSSVGSEDFTTTTDGKWIRGSVVLRADANGDDVAVYDETAREYASRGYREDENGYDVYTKPNNSLNQEQVKVKEVMAKVPKTDSSGLIVYEKDDSGNLKTDENGNLIPVTVEQKVEETIKTTKLEDVLDEYGEKELDKDGKPKQREVEVPRQALDENGNKKTDEKGNPVYVKAYEGAFSSTSDGVTTNGGEPATFKSAKVYLSNKDKSISGNDVSIYQTADIVNGVNGTDAKNVGIEGTNHNFTQADYTAGYNYHDSNKYGAGKYEAASDKNTTSGKDRGWSLTDAILINNVYQLEAIQDTAEVNPVKTTEQGADGGNAPETDTKATDDTVKDSNFGDLNGSYALGSAIHGGVYTYKGKEIDDAKTSEWNGGAGFKPIGNDVNPFTGGFTGSGGITTYGIYDITINRPTENNVGLFGVVDRKDENHHASIWSTSVIDSNITGKENVGGIVGLARGAWLDGDTVRKRVIAHDGSETLIQTAGKVNVSGNKNVGGLVGKMENSSMRNGTNASWVSGIDVKNEDGTTVSSENIGGLVGFAEGKRNKSTETIVGGVNEAYFSGMTSDKKDANENIIETGEKTTAYEYGFGRVTGGDDSKNVGGLVGKLGNSEGKAAIISVSDTKRFSHNGGEVTGGENVGGLVGTMENADSKIENAYNTNEQYALTPDSKIKEDATGAGTSKYGAVTGVENVGGLVGDMQSGTITTSYNAGNVKGNTNVGGLVGTMTDGTVDKGYNADNNTVVVKAANGEEYYGFTVEHTGSYKLVEVNGTQTYKWVPDETTGKTSYGFDQTTQAWNKYVYDSDGNIVSSKKGMTTADVLEEAPEEVRTYNNRIAYRDATVTGDENVGGVVGTMAGGTISQVYNAGRVNDVDTKGKADDESKATIGDFGGTKAGGTVNGGFYITTRQDGDTHITVQEQAWGTGATIGKDDTVSGKDLYHATNANGAV
ncbi:MAG: filamentous hemagglutinin N-terminal domain-containing protein, partial [Selenomonadaceae bacterium]